MASALSKCARICKHSQKGLLRPLVHQRFGSSHSNDPKLPEEFVFEEPVFKSVWWKRSAFGLIGLYALNKFDDYYYKEVFDFYFCS
ncbi:hypothetical protein DSO57_1038931 [Entomophthora muscae]|uniref:Uncharacterized protein n=1 Tax=Entomophthora muscae TaxID=34485 RepID=A0ACC2UIJ5_9FUNG|nr:hypothetical protein DSO57_1038931 [Entomophthora muscae]